MIENSNHEKRITPLSAWVIAARPKTLPAALAPVIVGSSLAYFDQVFFIVPSIAALLGALLLQIGVNLANDYFDFRKGVDTAERLGPVRVTQSGLIRPSVVKKAIFGVFLLAGFVGVYLTAIGGPLVFWVGVCAILSALAYSGGPYPLASNCLGDLFVFIFFGPVAVCGTYYVQAHSITLTTLLLSLTVGFLITAIIVVNNLRDIKTDRKTGKITLAVVLGEKGAVMEYKILLAGAYLSLPIYFACGQIDWFGLLPLISFPMAFRTARKIRMDRGGALNRLLADTARLAIIFSTLLSAGILLN